MIVGLVKPDSGVILLDGIDITSMPMYQRARRGIGYLPQEPSIFRKLTVQDNMMLVLEMNTKSRKARMEKIDEILGELQIDQIRDRKGFMLSGGERRRAEIARALAAMPRFILLDEPFTGVDPLAIMDIQQIVVDLKKKGIGVIITDHNVRETLEITDRAYILSEGIIRTSGTPSELHNDPIAIQYYLGDKLASSLSVELGQETSEREPNERSK